MKAKSDRTMGDKFINPLKEYADRIIPISNNFPDNLISLLTGFEIKLCNIRIELGKKSSWIEWDAYPKYYSFFYDFEENEEVVRNDFRNSELSNYEYVVMDFGYQNPLSKIPIDIFINYWYELLIIT